MIRLIPRDTGDGRIREDYYQVIAAFWQGRGSPPARAVLPTLGVIADEAACGFLYLDATGSGVSVMAWTATNPKVAAVTRAHAMLQVIEFLERESKALGYHTILCTHQHPSFLRLFQRRGYVPGDTGLTQLFKCLD